MFVCLFFLCMAAVPLSLMTKNDGKPHVENILPATIATEMSDKDMIAAATALCNEDFSDEAIKAVAIVVKTNVLAKGEMTDSANNNSNSELYERVKQIYLSNKEVLTLDNQPVAVPCSVCSNGFTNQSKDKTYLQAVASPWDCFSGEYNESLVCEGVSVNGVRYLCDKGLSAEEALLWYLPRFSVNSYQK